MNNSQQFDKHIKEQFNNYSPDVHPAIWENIIAKTESKKPVGFWFTFNNARNKLILIGLIMLLSTGGTWYYYNNIAKPSGKQAELKNEIDKTNGNTNKLPGHANGQELNITGPVLAADDAGKLNEGSSVSTAAKASIQIQSPSLLPGEVKKNSDNAANPSAKRYKDIAGLLNINMSTPGLYEDEYAGQGTLLGRLTFNAQRIAVHKKDNKEFLVSFSPIIYLPDCPGFEKDVSGNKKYLEFYTGPDFAFTSFSDTGNSAYLQKRKESTKFSSAYSAGIRYTKVFNNSMSVRGGINYSQINEKFSFVQGNLVQVTYIINAAGDTVGSYTTTGTRYKTTVNRYRSIDIPLVAGYELGNGKFHANINAGVIVNIYSWQKGDVLDTAYQPVNITTGKNSSPYSFKTNAGIGFIGAVSLYYKVNDRLHIMAEPYYRYNLSPLNKENITLKQKYQTAGLRLGIRLDLK